MAIYYVELKPAARGAINAELERAAPLIAAGQETGGFLFTPQGATWWSGISVEEATGPGPKAVHGVGALDTDSDFLDAIDQRFRREDFQLEFAGHWHLHPSGDDQPSDEDIERVDATLELFRKEQGCRTQRVLEIILVPEGNGWRPVPWVFYRGESKALGALGFVGMQPEGAVMKPTVRKGD